jgi:hypothetical protein
MPLRDVVINGLIRRGEVGTFISGAKARKTHTVQDLALHVAEGKEWLVFPTVQGRVLVLDFELYEADWQHRFKKIREVRGIDAAGMIDVQFFRGKENVNIITLENYFDSIAKDQYSLIILDALYQIYPPALPGSNAQFNENSNSDMTAFYKYLQRYAENLHSAIIGVHHTGKGSQADKAVVDSGRGASSAAGAADVPMRLIEHEDEDCGVFEASPRSFPPTPKVGLRWGWPVWNQAQDIDPEALKRPGVRGRPKGCQTTEERLAAYHMKAEEFAAKFCRAAPRTKLAIEGEAVAEGLSQRACGQLLDLAVEKKLVFRWTVRDERGRIRPVEYATEPQDLFNSGAGKAQDKSEGKKKLSAGTGDVQTTRDIEPKSEITKPGEAEKGAVGGQSAGVEEPMVEETPRIAQERPATEEVSEAVAETPPQADPGTPPPVENVEGDDDSLPF